MNSSFQSAGFIAKSKGLSGTGVMTPPKSNLRGLAIMIWPSPNIRQLKQCVHDIVWKDSTSLDFHG